MPWVGTPIPSGGAPATQWVISANYTAGTGTFELDFDPTTNQATRVGTLSTSLLSTIVNGSGTLFTTQVAIGASIQDNNHNFIGTVSSIISDTQLALSTLPARIVTGVNYVASAPILPYISQVADQAGNVISPSTDFVGQLYTIALPQPTNPVAALTLTPLTTSVNVQWTNPTGGAQERQHITQEMGKPTVGGTYPTVADGTYVPNATLGTSGGSNVVQNVEKTTAAGSTQSFTFTSLNSGESYDFIIYPYTMSPLDSNT